MKGSAFFMAATAAAASATALSSPSSSFSLGFFSNSTKQASTKEIVLSEDRDRSTSRGDEFAPKFDGLRFIETLVTAHR
ncbi:hypothetical protein MRB53_019467 [Persea americana]|uniref:Uncharacterized protein n=1 Tax=Persea americana TaxID=3435 RepID=A0ACC2KYB9_PERAE|nr:hypothetical protein MRB53_019467 [Persea americana]